MNTNINDIRTTSEFKGISFSGYKKTEVKKQFIENLNKMKIENSCYWCAELICSGHFIDLWEYIIMYFSKYIHLGNPKIITYLDKRYNVFKNIIHQGEYINELQIRNNATIRKLFAEIICVISLADKKNTIEIIKVIREDDYNITQINSKLIAPSISYATEIFKEDDPKELFIAINEFTYNITEKKNMRNACYWYEWIIDFNTICNKNKNYCYCETRQFVKVENKFRKDCVWILWDALLYYSRHNDFINTTMLSIFNIFCIKYTTASCKKRRHLFYFAISILTENISTNSEIIKNKNLIKSVTDQIDIIYKQIKKNEHSPNTDYLFSNLEKENSLEKSLMKMDMVNSININPT
tara:strand:+ start:675 stop:1733 length:1059 start_codon:yes stop_codon:yes gene_type:complete